MSTSRGQAANSAPSPSDSPPVCRMTDLSCAEEHGVARNWAHFFHPAVQFNTTVIGTGTRSPLRVWTRKRVPARLGT